MSELKELKTIKFQLMLSESEAAAIDDWSFQSRIRTRAEAIRRLCQMGLAVNEHSIALFEQARNGVHTYRDKSDELAALFADPHRPASEVAVAAAKILPELLQQLKDLSLLSSQVALTVLPYTVASNFEDAQELSELLKEVTGKPASE